MQWFWSLEGTTRAALIGAAAAIGTAVITLLGVGIGLILNRKSQQEERRLTLRREVYLNAANRYAAATQVLSSIANPWVDVRTTGSLIVGEFAAAVAQVQLVGDEGAMKAAVNLHREFVKIYTAMLIKRMPLERLRERVDANTVRVAQISNLRLQANSEIERASQALAELRAENTGLFQRLFEGQMELTKELMEELDKLAPLAMEATFAVKREFGIRVAEKPYAKFLTESTEDLKRSVMRSLADVEQQAGQTGQASTSTNPGQES
jgi:hypothetical protein